jgi:hypothetical protein
MCAASRPALLPHAAIGLCAGWSIMALPQLKLFLHGDRR